MRLFGHKYKNTLHLQKFCEECKSSHQFTCALAIISYKDGYKKEANEAFEIVQKEFKKISVISFQIEAGCIGERLVDKGVFVTILLSKKASIRAVLVDDSKIMNGFLSKYVDNELKGLMLFSSGLHLHQTKLENLLNSLDIAVAGIKAHFDTKKNTLELDGKEIKNGFIAVMLSGKNLSVNTYKNSQIEPISKKLQITNAKNGFVYEIEGLKLLEAYKKLLGEDIVNEDPLLAACRFPLILQDSKKALFIEAFDSEKAVMSGDIKNGDLLQIGYASLKNFASKSYEIARELKSKSPSAILIFSDYTLRKFFKNKTPLAIPGSLAALSENVTFFGDSEIYKDSKIEELNHCGVILALSEKEDKPKKCRLKEIKIPLTLADAFVNLVDDALKEQLEINEKLKKALDTQKIFISSISHDIRTPLNSIIGFLELLECTDLDTEQQSYVQRSLVSSKHLLRLISDVLDVSKIEARQMEFFESSFDYGSLLDDIKNIVSSRCENDVSLEFIDPKIDRYIVGDADRLKQILVNLLSNALKFTKHGYVKVNTVVKHRHKHKLELEIIVEDTGIGIEKSKLNEIFKPFYQTRETVSKNFSGTGLGLYICKNICEIMGGSIRCESRLGEGSKFFVSLPLKLGKKIDKNQGKLELRYDFSTNSFKETRLLIVEDVAFNAELISAMLDKKFGIKNIRFAKDGLEALEVIRKESFDIVFMDIQMPRLDGFSAIRLIREFDKTTPIIVMSANAFKEDMAKALKLGANDYITKPIRADKVAEALGKYGAKCQNGECDETSQCHEPTKLNMQRQMFAYYKNNLGLIGKDAKRLYGACLDSIKKTLSKADKALNDLDYKELYAAIHNLKGILASTGLDEALHTATALNIKAKNGSEGIKNAIDNDFKESFYYLKSTLSLLFEG